TALRGGADYNAITRLVGPQGLTRWTPDYTDVVPNVAESWSANADNSEYTFKLRQGMRWSDGEPFNADDILFAMNDIVANKQFFTTPPSRYVINDKLVSVSKIDDYTVVFKFAGPYRRFIKELATPVAQHPVLYAKHYCKQFHPKYNEHIADLLKQYKTGDWQTLMRVKCGDVEAATRWGNPDRPTLDPWLISTPYGASTTQTIMRRNPYFWQVDTKGQQLPYIDQLQFSTIDEVETIVLAAINGQLDFQLRHINQVQNRPVLAENARKGKYVLFSSVDTVANSAGLYLNYTTQKPQLRELIRNKDFRIALSLGMNRYDINNIIFLGQGQPRQIGPVKGSPFYNERLATQYVQYDPKTANQLLDKLGLTKRDADGYRLYPNGGRISLNAIVSSAMSFQVDTLELIRQQWAKLGIELIVNASERSLYYERAQRNDYDISIEVFSGGIQPEADLHTFLSLNRAESRQSLLWVQWFESNGKQGEEPAPNMKKRMALYEKWMVANQQKEADDLLKQIFELAADEFDVLGTVGPTKLTGVRNSRLTNVVDNMPSSWAYPTPAPVLPQQWFYK
ncbi:MAG: peptide transporter, partial [Rhodocyclales bacterium]|nr:peptide transporter [Rhodocyclales bacterium]